jgi:hypothetical protein
MTARSRIRRNIVRVEVATPSCVVFRDRHGAVNPSDRLALSATLPDGTHANLDVVVDRVERDAERPWMALVTCRPASWHES